MEPTAGGSCVAELVGSDFKCCSTTSCKPCPPFFNSSLLPCIAPRYLLLRPGAGCAAAVLPPPPDPLPPPPGPRGCDLSAAAVQAGSWVLRDVAPAGPGSTRLQFQPGPSRGSSGGGGRGGTCSRQRLRPAEVPRCFWASGFDRVVVSGDSTVRHLYGRLIG